MVNVIIQTRDPGAWGRDVARQMVTRGLILSNLKVAQVGFFMDQVWGGIKRVPEGFVLSSWKME